MTQSDPHADASMVETIPPSGAGAIVRYAAAGSDAEPFMRGGGRFTLGVGYPCDRDLVIRSYSRVKSTPSFSVNSPKTNK